MEREARSTQPLINAAEDDDVAAVEMRLALGDDIQCVDDLGWTALHEASLNGATSAVCELLLRRGASVHATTKYGETPLHMAAANETPCALFICRLLLVHGADVEATDRRLRQHANGRVRGSERRPPGRAAASPPALPPPLASAHGWSCRGQGK